VNNDTKIQLDILNAFKWDPRTGNLKLFEIGVTDGVVTLGGQAADYLDWPAMAEIAEHVAGVRRVIRGWC